MIVYNEKLRELVKHPGIMRDSECGIDCYMAGSRVEFGETGNVAETEVKKNRNGYRATSG